MRTTILGALAGALFLSTFIQAEEKALPKVLFLTHSAAFRHGVVRVVVERETGAGDVVGGLRAERRKAPRLVGGAAQKILRFGIAPSTSRHSEKAILPTQFI